MDASGLRRKDTTKGPPLRILSLDGGGVRGYSIFIIIQEIMHRTFVEMEGRAPRRHEIPKPADHFDLIVGTGTGGLIALMLGRLRLDLETCKELYVRMTRVVFETDKTILGIPTRSTLFKASKLEEAIREAVREHTADEGEGNDGSTGTGFSSLSPLSVASRSSAAYSNSPRRHSSNASVVSFSARSPTTQFARPAFNARGGGDPNAKLYDAREKRTKTAVTAMYKGTNKGSPAALLRSYDSRKETAAEFDVRIWEAGRATCSVGLAFKPIQVGQSVFHDDGGGTFNPSPEVLDEAVVNEWPGRDVGVFLSVGTGRRPKTSDANQTMWYEGFLGEFAEARKRLIAKIEGCEKIHEYMKKEHLIKRGVNVENYYRLNVEVGVGEFGMNEWHRLAEISTGTRKYLGREEKSVQSAAAKLAKIHRANQRFDRLGDVPELVQTMPDIEMPLAVELPGDMPPFPFHQHHTPPSRQSYESGLDSLPRPGGSPSPRSSGDRPRTGYSNGAPPPPPRVAPPTSSPGRPSQSQPPPAGHGEPPQDDDYLVVNAPTPSQWRTASGQDKIAITGFDERSRRPSEPASVHRPLSSSSQPHRIEPPPLPPKTPLPEHQQQHQQQQQHYSSPLRPPPSGPLPALPYPLDDDGPPPVDMTKKPAYRGR